MKKIEKLKYNWVNTNLENELEGFSIAPSRLSITDKLNEVIDRLNQEISQPEEKEFAPYFDNDYRCPECQEELLVTCKHPLELYCTCCRRDINLEETGEELTFIKERLPKGKDENNTEKWKKRFSNLLLHYLDDDLEEENLIEFIEQLLSERSFGKEELETIKQIIDTHDGHRVGYEALGDILEKADRLLSLEK